MNKTQDDVSCQFILDNPYIRCNCESKCECENDYHNIIKSILNNDSQYFENYFASDTHIRNIVNYLEYALKYCENVQIIDLIFHALKQKEIMKEKVSDKYTALLQATLTLVNNHGFHDTPMSKIAKLAGVSPATIYLYFENKQDKAEFDKIIKNL